MKQLSEFATLAEAQAYQETVEKNIGSGVMRHLLVMHGLFSNFHDSTTSDLKRATVENLRAGTEFDFRHSSSVGQANLSMLDMMINAEPDAAIQTQMAALKSVIIDRSAVTSYPLLNITADAFAFNQPETLALNTINTASPLRFKISATSPHPVNVVLEHRFGQSLDDMTPWHRCGSTTVMYKQSEYSIIYAKNSSAVLEFRLACLNTVGIYL